MYGVVDKFGYYEKIRLSLNSSVLPNTVEKYLHLSTEILKHTVVLYSKSMYNNNKLIQLVRMYIVIDYQRPLNTKFTYYFIFHLSRWNWCVLYYIWRGIWQFIYILLQKQKRVETYKMWCSTHTISDIYILFSQSVFLILVWTLYMMKKRKVLVVFLQSLHLDTDAVCPIRIGWHK